MRHPRPSTIIAAGVWLAIIIGYSLTAFPAFIVGCAIFPFYVIAHSGGDLRARRRTRSREFKRY